MSKKYNTGCFTSQPANKRSQNGLNIYFISTHIQAKFEAQLSFGETSDIALDDIKLETTQMDSCRPWPPNSKPDDSESKPDIRDTPYGPGKLTYSDGTQHRLTPIAFVFIT